MTKPIVNIITIININPMIILKKTESVLTSSSVISAITNIDFKDKDMVSTMVIKPLKKGIVFNWFTTLNPHFIDTVSISFSVLYAITVNIGPLINIPSGKACPPNLKELFFNFCYKIN